jgi:hypothetical protein
MHGAERRTYEGEPRPATDRLRRAGRRDRFADQPRLVGTNNPKSPLSCSGPARVVYGWVARERRAGMFRPCNEPSPAQSEARQTSQPGRSRDGMRYSQTARATPDTASSPFSQGGSTNKTIEAPSVAAIVRMAMIFVR